MRRFLLFGLLLFTLTAWADTTALVTMLKSLFKQPRANWARILEQNRALLDSDFFVGVEQRLVWDAELGQWEDAVRFAILGDLGCQVVGRPPRYCAGLRATLERRGLGALDYGVDDNLAEAGLAAPWHAPAMSMRPSPEMSSRSLRRAMEEWERGNRDVALRYFRDASVQDPNSVEAHLWLGLSCAEVGQTGQAILELERTVALSPHYKQAWLQLGRNYELQFDEIGNVTDWDLAGHSFRKAGADLEVRRLLAKRERGRARNLALADGTDWSVWIPSRRDTYWLGELVGNLGADNEDEFLDLQPTQASGALVWRGTRRGVLVWLRSRQSDTRLLRGGRQVLELGCPLNPCWGRPTATFVQAKGRARLLVYAGSNQDFGLTIESGRVRELIFMEKGRLLKEMRQMPDWSQVR